MYKLQALKAKLPSIAIGTVLAVTLAVMGFAPMAFATNVTNSDVFLYRDGEIDPPLDETMVEGVDYDVTLPTGGLYGVVSKAGADDFGLDYATINDTDKKYSLELQNNTTFDMFVKNVQVQDDHSALNIVEKAGFTYASDPNTMWTEFKSHKGGTAIDVKTALSAGTTGMTPSTVAAWTIDRATPDGQDLTPGTLGVAFTGAIKNVDLSKFPALDDPVQVPAVGLQAYTIVWTLGFNGNIPTP